MPVASPRTKTIQSKYLGTSGYVAGGEYSVTVDFDAVDGRLVNGWKLLKVVCGFSAATDARQISFFIGNEETKRLNAEVIVAAHTLEEVTAAAVRKSEEMPIGEFIQGFPVAAQGEAEIPLLNAVRYSKYPFSYSPCHICGHEPMSNPNNIPARQWVNVGNDRKTAVSNPMSSANSVPNAGAVRFWSPDDGWVVAALCYDCYTEYARIQPQPDDYAYESRDEIGESFTDEA